MRKLAWVVSAILLAAAGSPAAQDGVTLVTASRIHTMDTARPMATAMAYGADGRILAVGQADALAKQYPRARRVDVGNATVVPGLIDAHAHIGGLGLAMLSADLVGTRDKAGILQRLRVHEQTLKPGEWLVGGGWDQNDWPQQRFPNAADLDAAFPDRPVWLSRVDGHAGWANSAAIRAVRRDLSGDWQPDGGRIDRDAAGKPTGLFIDNAMLLVEQARPAMSEATAEHALEIAMRAAAEQGLTGVHDAGITLAELGRYQRLADRGRMPLRISAMADGDSAALESLCRNGLYRHPSGRLQMRAVKLYADGALGSRGAAMLEDYSDDHGNRGLMVMSPAQLAAATAKAKRCGVQVATHAIGDRGNREALDAYATALGTDAASDHRWRIEHAQILSAQDLPRLAGLRVIASMQPTHATSDMPWAEDRVGAQRIAGAYAWRQLRDSGARLALGSDFPVERVDPRLGLQAATTRADGEGKPVGGWFPGEKLTAFEALRGFTLDAAHAGFADAEVGSLVAGKRADFVVLAADPLASPEARLKEIAVLATYVDGKPVFEAASGR
ncbi:MAG: amidohydrolase [Thermomonas sp.]|uniref:amidohydrolase n=1 Tax=Thermomonas sp. TaxID=1971895 RepID=UPI001B5736C8|nr:amidohydrolase [Thermomonas sp.]MBK6332478.1 amidohydrolase [Thermomonas sp.]MBP7158084.1 amidohydrolase [Thermomonas sp.]MBP7787914.1 amidohydrolase [Thermomonas sp.]MBP8615320.1 amidohydrolase [Thermomonas sp.]MBP8647499.1 amidohydrolase [Thermomonas sp.]